jgi:hypothetical protein
MMVVAMLVSQRSLGVLLAIMLAGALPAAAQSLDPASKEALAATLGLLRDPAARDAAVATNPQAAAMENQLRAVLATPELQQEFYSLAADIFSEIVQGSGGDVGKMTDALEAARSNPSLLAALLSPRTLERLRVLAGKISDQNR